MGGRWQAACARTQSGRRYLALRKFPGADPKMHFDCGLAGDALRARLMEKLTRLVDQAD